MGIRPVFWPGPGARPHPPRGAGGEAGFSLMEVLVALFIVALAVFPMLQIVQHAETDSFNAKFSSLAAQKARALLSDIAATAKPGDFGEGDLSDLTDEQGYDPRYSFGNVFYEWRVEAVDLSSDILGDDETEEDADDPFAEEDTDPIKDPDEESEIDDRFRVRYVKLSIFYSFDNGQEREVMVETFLPPIPRDEEDADSRIQDAVPPNTGTGP